nr:unnamed protein product [Digitaria exilis]
MYTARGRSRRYSDAAAAGRNTARNMWAGRSSRSRARISPGPSSAALRTAAAASVTDTMARMLFTTSWYSGFSRLSCAEESML